MSMNGASALTDCGMRDLPPYFSLPDQAMADRLPLADCGMRSPSSDSCTVCNSVPIHSQVTLPGLKYRYMALALASYLW